MVRPVIPAYQGRQTDDAAGQPDQQDHQVDPAPGPLRRVVDGVVDGPVPGDQQVRCETWNNIRGVSEISYPATTGSICAKSLLGSTAQK